MRDNDKKIARREMIKSNRDRSIEDHQDKSFQTYMNNIHMRRESKTPETPLSPVCMYNSPTDDPHIYHI